jgi:mannose/fructose/N-acetylgalactosamine-specific phosphotransferase system component IID
MAGRRTAGGNLDRGIRVNGKLRALLRLFAVQGTWNYERMLGVGMGYAAEPLLEDLKAIDPVRHGEAVVRSTEFFNCNPNLAGVALGATARAEYEAVPGAQIVRLRTALCSPLGALGDQLFWVGLVPALVGFAIVALVQGAGWWAIAGFLLAYNLIRLWTGYWSLRIGMENGMRVGAAIGSSWLPRAIEWVGPAAGFALGATVPVVSAWYLGEFGGAAVIGTAGVAVAGVALTRWFGPGLTSVRFALVAMILLLLFRRIGL